MKTYILSLETPEKWENISSLFFKIYIFEKIVYFMQCVKL